MRFSCVNTRTNQSINIKDFNKSTILRHPFTIQQHAAEVCLQHSLAVADFAFADTVLFELSNNSMTTTSKLSTIGSPYSGHNSHLVCHGGTSAEKIVARWMARGEKGALPVLGRWVCVSAEMVSSLGL